MPDLVDPLAGRRAVAESAMDSVRAKFGRASVETGYTFGRGNRGRPERDDA
jgi:DNA polymerase IV